MYPVPPRPDTQGLTEMAIREDVGLSLFERFTRYTNENTERAACAHVSLFRRHGIDPAQGALAFVNSRDFVTFNIIGATTLAQLQSNIASMQLTLPQEVLDGIEAIHQRFPNPAP